MWVQGLAEQLMMLDTPVSEAAGPLRLSTLGCAILSQILGLPHVRALLRCICAAWLTTNFLGLGSEVASCCHDLITREAEHQAGPGMCFHELCIES